jgi:hypothetical protein
MSYLNRSAKAHGRLIYPFLDYWRFMRSKSLLNLFREFPEYIRRRWKINSIFLAPLEIARAVLRSRGK